MKGLITLYEVLLSLFTFCFLVLSETPSQQCSREGSRLVRKVLEKNFYPVFKNHGVNMSFNCPLQNSRDLYYLQEYHKTYEHHARWTCEVCGKPFYREDFIDRHMERKHSDMLVKEEDSPVCLADYCKLFRCEAVDRKRRNNHFWSQALCSKESMKNLKKKCLSVIQSCMPDLKTHERKKQIYDEIVEETCSLINCKDYWQPLHYELSSMQILYYVTFTPVFISAIAVYYYNVWEHYYGDESEEKKK